MIRYARKNDRDELLELCLTSMAIKEKPYLEFYFHTTIFPFFSNSYGCFFCETL